MKNSENFVLLFDFDGTLVNSMPCFSETMYRVINDEKLEYPENIIEILTPLGYVGSAKYITEVLGSKENEASLVKKMHEYAYDGYANSITLKDGVWDFLHSRKADGYSLNVLTASPHKVLDVCLKRNGVWGLFDNVWSCEDFGTTKSDPKIYLSAAEKLGVSVGQVAFFDDNLHAVKTANEAGAFTVGVYDESGKAFTERLRASAHAFIESFTDADLTCLTYNRKTI